MGPAGGAKAARAAGALAGRAGAGPRLTARRTIYSGWNRLDVLTIEAPGPDGSPQRYEREIVDHGEASAALLIDAARDMIILVRQWRAPLIAEGRAPFSLEACSGLLDEGESPEAAARREVLEETGYELRTLRRIGEVAPSIGTLTERIHLFVAEVGEKVRAGGGDADEGEDVEIVELPRMTLFDMAARGEIVDAKTLVLVQRLMLEQGARPQPA
jgi:nudix-type nucleoside diphosphatase (YffH/AdpP family)